MKRTIFALCAIVLACCSGHKDPGPNGLRYPALSYAPPNLKAHEYTLKNGITAFIVPDAKLPVFDIEASIRTGSLLNPENAPGICEATAELLRSGGTRTIPADSFDETVDFFAASLSSDYEATNATAALSILKDNLDTGLYLFDQMLRNPGFETQKLALLKTRMKESIQHRFDHPSRTMNILFDHAMYGPGKISGIMTTSNVDRISTESIRSFYKNTYRPKNIILAVSGKFEVPAIIEKLNATLGAWEPSNKPETAFPNITIQRGKAFYFVEKDINQAYVSLGLPLVQRPNPDYYPLVVMNWIVGGAPFTSRLSKKIREYQGLAYSAGSQVKCGYFYPGAFKVYMQTKSASTAYAIGLAKRELDAFVKNGATAAELAEAQQSIIDAFPAMFKTGADISSAFAQNRYLKRDDAFYDSYRDTLRAITLGDIRSVAEKYLVTDSMVICVVGKYDACAPGDDVHPEKLNDFGPVTRLTEQELERICTSPGKRP